MKLAHLILAHSDPMHLTRLIKRLRHPDAHFFVHVDKKTDVSLFQYPAISEQVTFIEKREVVQWGSYSLVRATINGFKQILNSGIAYDYINLMSGQDYPLKSTTAIHDFLTDNPGKAFMDTFSLYDDWREALPRFVNYHFVDLNFPGRFKAQRVINALMPKRKFPMPWTLVGRSQWFTISLPHAAYILDCLKTHKSVGRYFKYTWGPDEVIFHTILHNSPYQQDMVNNSLRYIEWPHGQSHPKILTMADAATLTISDKLFARKFSHEQDHEILDHLDKIAA